MYRSMCAGALAFACLAMAPCVAQARVYSVGPPGSGRDYTSLADVFAHNTLGPGDVVEVDGDAVYPGGIVLDADDGGRDGKPLVVRWRRDRGGTRPVLEGGDHTIKFERANHVVLEGFEIRGGQRSCIFSEAHDVTVRDSVIHHCPAHGILGADQNSGSFTLEYSEVAHSGQGTRKHAIYMQSDEVAWPGSVFRMRYNHVHSATGGVLVRVRHERAEIHYNWIEGGRYGEVELIGPDCETQQEGWSAGMAREDAELVGNVIVHRSRWPNAIRIGGDLNGRSQGRVRLVNNTLVFLNRGAANAVMVQLGAGSLEMHNNVVHQVERGRLAIVRENPPSSVETPFCGPQGREPWTTGRLVAGSHNWVPADASLVPPEWTATLAGTDPGFVDVGRLGLRPAADSPLRAAGTATPHPPARSAFPRPVAVATYEPPARVAPASGWTRARIHPGGRPDIGALEAVPR